MQRLYEKEIIGESDAKDHSVIGWFFLAILIGFFAIPFAYFRKVSPDGIHYRSIESDTEKQVYLNGYQRAVKKKRIIAILLGMLTDFMILLLLEWY